MNNVCKKCAKLNPLDNKVCHYCGGQCKKINNAQMSNFMINFNQKKEEEEKMMEEEKPKNDNIVHKQVCKKCRTVWNTNINKDGKCYQCGCTKTDFAKFLVCPGQPDVLVINNHRNVPY